jgi:hypothetical protein
VWFRTGGGPIRGLHGNYVIRADCHHRQRFADLTVADEITLELLFRQNERVLAELRDARDERAGIRDDMAMIREDIALLSAMVRRIDTWMHRADERVRRLEDKTRT